jgi:hypothetical protein
MPGSNQFTSYPVSQIGVQFAVGSWQEDKKTRYKIQDTRYERQKTKDKRQNTKILFQLW